MSLKHIITSLRLPCHSSIHYRCIALFQDTGSNGSWTIPRRSGHGGHYNCSTFCACGDHLWHPCCVAFLKFQLFQCAMVGTTIFCEISWTCWTELDRPYYLDDLDEVLVTAYAQVPRRRRGHYAWPKRGKWLQSLTSGRPHSSTRCCRHVNFDCE